MNRPLKRTGLVLGLASVAILGTCNIQAKIFQKKHLECEPLRLPDSPGVDLLTKNICVVTTGSQPLKAGVDQKDLGDGRKATTLFLEWDHDGIVDSPKFLQVKKLDAEPITLITRDGKSEEVQTRSHWRVGKCPVKDQKIVVAITNSFHTPIPMNCDPIVVDPKHKGGINTLVFKTVFAYAQAVGENAGNSFAPLREIKLNEPPGSDHPARTQPIFSN